VSASQGSGEEIVLDLPKALGADAGVSIQCLSFYIPNKNKESVEIGNQRKWVLEALTLLSRIGGGATAMPSAEGIWLDIGRKAVWDHPVVAYSYVDPERLRDHLPLLREFLHRMGRETGQGEVVFEFNDCLYRIRNFDQPGNPTNGQENR